MLDSFKELRKQRPDATSLLAGVDNELKRAKRDAEADALYKSSFDSANTLESVASMITLAGERGDVDGLLALGEKYDRLAAASNQPLATSYINATVAQAIARAMGMKADVKDNAGIIKLLDKTINEGSRPDQLSRRMKAKASPAATSRNAFFIFTTGKPARTPLTSVDFPTPNTYFDYSMLYVLRNAFEIYKKDDLASDLIKHCRQEAEKATEDANKLVRTLATSYLLWWNDEKDEALKEYAKATDLSKNDIELKLSLAELRAQRGEPIEALEAADSVEPLDQKTMQRRETLALRLAVLAGDVERARKASERLFGLRLDAETQVQLATQMNQLGMHELSEAVLARARRRSGGNAAALVGLMLQYQKQGKADVAIQVANQILRQTTGQVNVGPQTVASLNQSNSRTQAMQVLARSGKLKELIARAEAQLETSPNSQQVLQTLVDYYQANNQRDKVKTTYEKMIKLHPDDPKIRMQIAVQLTQSGAPAEAIPHFEIAIKKDPRLFTSQYNTILQAYQRAGKAADVTRLFDSIDFKSFSNNPYVISNAIQNLFNSQGSRDQGMTLLRKAWKEMPDFRPSLLGVISDAEVWKLPEVYDYAREAVIPAAGKPIADGWAGMDDVTMWNGNAGISNVVTQLVDAANRQGKIDALTDEVAEAVKRSGDWTGGKALLAILKARRGKVDEARAGLEPMTAKGFAIPHYARMVIAQELENVEPLRDIALKILEASITENMDEIRNNGNGFEYGPGQRLVQLYKKAGRNQEARDFVLKYATSGNSFANYDPSYAAYQRINQSMTMGNLLFELGYPADSAKFYSEIANDTQSIENAKPYYGNVEMLSNQILEGLNRSLQGMDEKTLSQTLRTILTPKAEVKTGEPRLDLVLLCHPKDLEKAAVTCLFAESIKVLKDNKELAAEIREIAERLVAAYPDDLSVLAASALVSGVEGKAETLGPSVERLSKWVDAMPLDALPANGRANARQREEARRQLIVWVVAREALKYDATRSTGDKFAARGLDAAARQADNLWSLAMLREAAQVSLDRGDKPAAEASWRAMLKLVMMPPATSKPPKTAQAPKPKAAIPQNPTVAPSVITIERFDQIAQLARLAASQDLARVSIEAMRDALSGGPPVTPIAIPNANTNRVIRLQRGEAQVDPVAQKVEEQLFALDAVWARSKTKVEPSAIYDVYLEAVLPKARPNEIFLYARPLSISSLKLPRSVGALLVKYAVKAGKADELKAAIEARAKSPLAAAPAKVLLAQLEFERKNYKETARILDSIREGVDKGLAVTGEQACLVSLPALDVKESAEAASKVLESSIARMGATDVEEPIGSLLIRLARYDLASGNVPEARKIFQDYATRMQQFSSRYNGDYSLYRRKYHLSRIAGEFARGSQVDDALDQIGQWADAPISVDYGDDATIDQALTPTIRLLAALPIEERYQRLKTWTFPTPDRKSIRWIAKYGTDLRVPAPFVGPKPVTDGGLITSAQLLVDTAKELNQLDALADELKPLVDAKVENADKLLALVDLTSSTGKAALPVLRARIDFIKAKEANPLDDQINRVPSIDLGDTLLARKALGSTDPEVNAVGEELVERIIDAGKNSGVSYVISRDHAKFRARKVGAPGVATLEDPGLALWSPRDANPLDYGVVTFDRPLWAESDGVVAHVRGPGAGNGGGVDLLTCRYPLTGTFEFSVDVFMGSYGEGCIGYGGIFADPFNPFSTGGMHALNFGDAVNVPGVFARRDGFNRMTIRVAPERVTYLINGHLYYEDKKATPTSPWVALNAPRQTYSAFRNPSLSGRPEIPREVALTSGDSLDGWDASHYRETSPTRRASANRVNPGRIPAEPRPRDYDWHAADGEILGRKLDASNPSTNRAEFPTLDNSSDVVQSLLSYLRPLDPGDSITYEFFYEPGEVMTHAAVGHLAFLVEPDGVRLHALVSARASDAPGEVGVGNILDDPAGRREPITLKAGEWNTARVQIKGANVAIEINGKLAHERALDPTDDRVFSFYHDKAATASKIRNVVLKGDWPTELSPEQTANLFVRSDRNADRATKRARAAVVDEPLLVLSAGEVARAARKLPAAERYAKLLAWVLPGDDHASIRLVGEFGPTGPAIPEKPDEAKGSRQTTPPTLDSPAVDLVLEAEMTGRLDELVKAIEAAEPLTSTDRRGKLALLALVRHSQGKKPEMIAALGELKELARTTITKQTPDWQRWPELIVGLGLIHSNSAIKEMNSLMDEVIGGINRDFFTGPLERPIRHVSGMIRLVDKLAMADSKPVGWVEATIGTAETRGRGQPWPTWTYRDGTWTHRPGHATDLMFLASPIQGNFEVNCELTSFGWREARLSYGGTSIGLNWSLNRFEVQRYGRSVEADGNITPPIKDLGDFYPYRLVVQDGRRTTYIKGQKVDERAVSGESDPWLALFVSGSLTGSVRNLKITGQPTIPDTINLSAASDLVGWAGDYYGEATQGEDAVWQKRGAEIVGRKLATEATPGLSSRNLVAPSRAAETIAGSKHESILRYARPMAEDGEITYEFLHEPGKTIVHPSLDRLAFLLDADGVKIHRITDGSRDRTGLDPANTLDEPSARRGPARLPLKPGEWNRMSLVIRGNDVTLTLNGEVIFVRPLEVTNQRDFGFFTYLDETEARVRNVVYRGNWPKALPVEAVSDREK